MDMNTDVKYVKGIGSARGELLARVGVRTAGELVRYYPRAYENWQDTYSIADAPMNVNICIKAVVSSVPVGHRTMGGRMMYKTLATDGRDIMSLNFFNNQYVVGQLVEGGEYLFFGKLQPDIYGGCVMFNPRYLRSEPQNGGLHPVYPLTGKLNSKTVANAVGNALASMPELPESLPVYLLGKFRLPGIREALEKIHFPKSEDDVLCARRRLIFEELLTLQTGLLLARSGIKKDTAYAVKTDYTPEFEKQLPFKLTRAQKNAVTECVKDMSCNTPMNRLLQGEVGSGKTAVAAALIYSAVKNGYTAAVMVPTEVLAEQHFKTFKAFFANASIRTELLTGSMKPSEKKAVKERAANGETDLLIGTHAIIQDSVELPRIALTVTDEQHRFGVAQRSALRTKGNNPHTLVMSATPIPRTLAMIIYGDLDISVLDELPAGRIPISTYRVGPDYRARVYEFIRKNARAGRQSYVVCPLVEEGETDRLPAEKIYKTLSETVFPELKVGLLHGKMKPSEKERVMRGFSAGEIQVLVCTVVIEVGIDVPNATVMLIENAECFGLSQLHQLRGRIGRGKEKSYCILMSDIQTDNANGRFDVMCSTSDGFKIADEDLRMRGPGDFFGSRQHGLPELRLADLTGDSRILYAAREEAKLILENDANLISEENAGLRASVSKLFESFDN